MPASSPMKVYALRLLPHQDLKKSLLDFARKNNIHAGIILTCVGSLEQCNLRFANQKEGVPIKGFFEVVSLTGTMSSDACHLHIAVADKTGITTGGHLLEGNLIYTTAEVAIADLTDISFSREIDTVYGYHELVVKSRAQTK